MGTGHTANTFTDPAPLSVCANGTRTVLDARDFGLGYHKERVMSSNPWPHLVGKIKKKFFLWLVVTYIPKYLFIRCSDQAADAGSF